MDKRHLLLGTLATVVGIGVVLWATRLGDDDEISEAVATALEQNSQIDASHLKVDVSKGVVTIDGDVPGDEMRQIVIDEVQRLEGVGQVVDKMKIELKQESQQE